MHQIRHVQPQEQHCLSRGQTSPLQPLQPQKQHSANRRQTSPLPRSPWRRPAPLKDPDFAAVRTLPTARLKPLGLELFRHHQQKQRRRSSRQRRQAQPLEDSVAGIPEVAHAAEISALSTGTSNVDSATQRPSGDSACEILSSASPRQPISHTASCAESTFEDLFLSVSSEVAILGPEHSIKELDREEKEREEAKKELDREGKEGEQADPPTGEKEGLAGDTSNAAYPEPHALQRRTGQPLLGSSRQQYPPELKIRAGELSSQPCLSKPDTLLPDSALLCSEAYLRSANLMLGMKKISELQFRDGLVARSQHRGVLLQKGYMHTRLAAAGLSPIAKELSEGYSAFSRSVFAGESPPAGKIDHSKSTMERLYFEGSVVQVAVLMEDGCSMAPEEACTLRADISDVASNIPAAKQPSHLRISGLPFSPANGIYTLQPMEVAAAYRSTTLFMRHGTLFGLWWAKADSLKMNNTRKTASGMDSRIDSLASLPLSAATSRPTSRASGWHSSCCSPSPTIQDLLQKGAIKRCNSQSKDEAAASGTSIQDGSACSVVPWSAWVVGILGDDGALLARARPEEAGNMVALSPGTVCCWERLCDKHEISDSEESDGDVCSVGTSLCPRIVWRAAEEVTVEALAPPPNFIYFLDATGHLNGTYSLAEDINGRTSYAREDQAVTVRWSCQEECWIVQLAAHDRLDRDGDAEQTSMDILVEATARSLTGDVPDPSQAAGWERWSATSGEWKLDEGIFVLPGRMPPTQLFISGCSLRAADGIYDRFTGVHEGRPFYEQVGLHNVQHHTLLWSDSRKAWLLQARAIGKEVACGTQCRSSKVQEGDGDCEISQHPDGPWKWQDHCDSEAEAASETKAMAASRLAGPANDGCEACKGDQQKERLRTSLTSHAESASIVAQSKHGCSMHVTAVQPSPETLFLDVGDFSQLLAARGVYEFVADKQGQRGCFQKSVGGWRLLWVPTQGAWHLATDDSDAVRARAVYDAPDPTRIPCDCHWQVLSDTRKGGRVNQEATNNSPAAPVLHKKKEVETQKDRLSSESLPVWQDDADIVVQSVDIPPRRVSVSGNGRYHPLYGLYFLRDVKNGRPSYSKEPVEGQPYDRGHIQWGGSSQAAWRIVAQVRKGECWHGLLKDDLPNPSMMTNGVWEVETSPNDQLDKSRREQAEEEEAYALRNPLPLSDGTALGRLLASMGEPKEKKPSRKELEDEIRKKNSETLGLTCLPVDDAAPDAVFLTGHSAKLDGVFFLQDTLEDGRPTYQTQLGGMMMRWVRREQRWSVKATDGSAGELSSPCDTPDPSAAPESSWLEDKESADIADQIRKEEGEESEESHSQSGSVGEQSLVGRATRRRASSSNGLMEGCPVWFYAPNLSCVSVQRPPDQIVVTGPVCERCDFTGVYIRVECALACQDHQQRPFYRMLKDSKAACCSIRYLAPKRLWMIERVPELKGRAEGFRVDLNSCTFTLASAAYDSPHPALVSVPWKLRRNGEWILPSVPISCRIASSEVTHLLASDM